MKTIDEIINNVGVFTSNVSGLNTYTKENVRLAMLEYGKEVLQLAAKKALIIRNPTGKGQSSETDTCSSFEGDLGYEDYIPVEYSIHKDSILNLINELK